MLAQRAEPPVSLEGPVEATESRSVELMRLLWKVDHALRSHSKWVRNEQGLTTAQRQVLELVRATPGCNASVLARWFHIHPSTLTGILKTLQSRGYIERRSDANDARRARLYLTPTGSDAVGGEEDALESYLARAVAQVDGADLGATRRVLEAVVRNLKRSAGRPKANDLNKA